MHYFPILDVNVMTRIELHLTQEENAALSPSINADVTTITKIKKNIDVARLAALMAVIYSMVKQDCLMQVMIYL